MHFLGVVGYHHHLVFPVNLSGNLEMLKVTALLYTWGI